MLDGIAGIDDRNEANDHGGRAVNDHRHDLDYLDYLSGWHRSTASATHCEGLRLVESETTIQAPQCNLVGTHELDETMRDRKL